MNDSGMGWLGLERGAKLEKLGTLVDGRALGSPCRSPEPYAEWFRPRWEEYRDPQKNPVDARGWTVQLVRGKHEPIALIARHGGKRAYGWGEAEHVHVGVEDPQGAFLVDPRRITPTVVMDAGESAVRIVPMTMVQFDVEWTALAPPQPFARWLGESGNPWLAGLVLRTLSDRNAGAGAELIAAGLVIRHAEPATVEGRAERLERLMRGERDPSGARSWAAGQDRDRHEIGLRWGLERAAMLESRLREHGEEWREHMNEGVELPELLEVMLLRDDLWCLRASLHEATPEHELAIALDRALQVVDVMGKEYIGHALHTVGGRVERLVHVGLLDHRLWWKALRAEDE